MSIEAKLKKAKALFKKAVASKDEFLGGSTVPDGVCIGKLKKAEVGESQTSGRLQIAWGVKLTTGEYKGETVYWYDGLATEQNLMFVGRTMARMGKELPEDPSELEKVLRKLVKEEPSLRIKLTTSGEYQNVRVLKKLDGLEDEPSEPDDDPEPAEADDPEPSEDPDPEPDDDPEPAEADPDPEPDEPTLDVGMRVLFQIKGESVAGTVEDIDYKEEKALVKTDKGKKWKVKVDKLSPAPKTSVKRKK